MNIILYGNGAAGNHGCEAIIRGTIELLGLKDNSYFLSSNDVLEDKKYNLHKICKLKEAKTSKVRINLRYILSYLQMKIMNNKTAMDGLAYLDPLKKNIEKIDIAFSVGGDNYCYGDTYIYGFLNRQYNKRKIKTVLWGCSVEPDVVYNKVVSKDLSLYSMVVARESITYSAIRKVNDETYLMPDPAFFMKSKKCSIDEKFWGKQVIGINISPMIISNEKVKGIVFENYRRLLQYILENTESNIALIPHVVWKSNDDRVVLEELYNKFKKNERLKLVSDHNSEELKYIISRCDVFIGARTHATIAAYSSEVPTLVVGYSVKAKGIAKDLFGTDEGYVLPVQSITKDNELTEAFKKIYSQKEEIRKHLKKILPDYKNQSKRVLERIKGI